MTNRFDGDEGAADHVGAARARAYAGHARARRLQQCGLHGLKAVDGPQVGRHLVVELVIVRALIADAPAIHAQVAVRVDEAGEGVQTGGVKYFRLVSLHVGRDLPDFAVLHQDIRPVGLGVYGVHNGGVLD